jgi:hypothetical protein
MNENLREMSSLLKMIIMRERGDGRAIQGPQRTTNVGGKVLKQPPSIEKELEFGSTEEKGKLTKEKGKLTEEKGKLTEEKARQLKSKEHTGHGENTEDINNAIDDITAELKSDKSQNHK